MGLIAGWGVKIMFRVNSEKIYTFRNGRRTVAGRWAEHTMLNGKPRLEFQGPELGDFEYEVVLSGEHGVKPRETLELLEQYVESGDAEILWIGRKKVGDNPMALVSMSETWDRIMNQGELLQCTLNLAFKEYV